MNVFEMLYDFQGVQCVRLEDVERNYLWDKYIGEMLDQNCEARRRGDSAPNQIVVGSTPTPRACRCNLNGKGPGL